MQIIKKISLLLVLFILVGCQTRLGTIKVLNNLKVSDISGIYVKTNSCEGYLTENDETTIINILKKIDDKDLVELNLETSSSDYSLFIETNVCGYELLTVQPNIISIDKKCYKLDEKTFQKIISVIRDANYLQKS